MADTLLIDPNDGKFEDICRTCLTKDDVMTNIFDGDGETYHKMLMHCTQLVINENDGLPKQICTPCISDVSKLFSFKIQCENAEANLRLFIKNSRCELQSLRATQATELSNKYNHTDEMTINLNYRNLSKKKNIRSVKKSSRLISKESKRKLSKLSIRKSELLNGINENILHEPNDDIVKYNDNFNQEDSNSDEVLLTSKKMINNDTNNKLKRISSVTAFGCRKCDVHFLTWQELEKHNVEHLNDENTQKLSCRYCNTTFLHQRHINPHIRKMHSELDRFQCGYCGDRWKDIRSLKNHLLKHSPGDASSFSTEINKCEEIVADKINLYTKSLYLDNNSSDDIKNIDKHSEIKNEFEHNNFSQFNDISKECLITAPNNLICYKCRQLFIDLESLQVHMNTVHVIDTVNESNLENHDAYDQIQGTNNDLSFNINSNEHFNLLKNNDETTTESFSINKDLIYNSVDEIAKSSDAVLEDDKNGICKNSVKKHHCSICNKFFKFSNDLKRHEITHDPDKPYHCKFGRCRWTFATEHELDVHTNVNHSDGTFECRFCHKTFKHARNLRQHMLQHQLTKRFACKHCKKGFNHLHHLQNHERTHTGDLPFLCQECGRGFATKDRLIFHIRRHSDDRPFSCMECGKKFLSTNDLKVHIKTHSGDRPYMCSICGKTFTTRSNLNKHARVQHVGSTIDDGGGLENFKKVVSSCNICGFNAETLQKLDQHMKSHTCQYFCPICPKSFSLTSALDAHIKTHAMGDRSHKCDMCGWAFNRAEHLRAHIARRHTTEGRLTCKHCSCTFVRAQDLRVHLRTHDQLRPYICSECGRGFAQSGTLRIHLRIHSGERPYICGICHKAHRSAGPLAVHMRTHSTQLVQADSQSNSQIANEPDEKNKSTESHEIIEHSTVIKHVESITPVNTIDFQDLREMQTMSKITKDITDHTEHHDIGHHSSLSLEQLVVDTDNINIIETVDANGEIVFISED